MKKLLPVIFTMILAVPAMSNLRYDSGLKIRVYFSFNDKTGQDAVIKGKVISVCTAEKVDNNELSGVLQNRTKATVRLTDKNGLHTDEILYVINPNNIVVSKLNVKYIFDNKTFGDMLIGYGNLRLTNEGYRVVKAVTEGKEEDAYINKARGDYYHRTGDKGKAIAEYKKAIEMDSGDPSARLALGLVYYHDGIYNFAYSELTNAYNHISSLYDNDDKFTLLKTLAEISEIEAYKNTNLYNNRVEFRKSGISYCKEALRINNKSVEVYYLLGEFYFKQIKSNRDEDKLARDTFLKILELNPLHTGANLRLSELYMKHNNREKGLYYAKKAVESDPSNQKALEILKPYE